jgi:hypothetical protein
VWRFSCWPHCSHVHLVWLASTAWEMVALKALPVRRREVMPAVPAHLGVGENRFGAFWTVLGRRLHQCRCGYELISTAGADQPSVLGTPPQAGQVLKLSLVTTQLTPRMTSIKAQITRMNTTPTVVPIASPAWQNSSNWSLGQVVSDLAKATISQMTKGSCTARITQVNGRHDGMSEPFLLLCGQLPRFPARRVTIRCRGPQTTAQLPVEHGQAGVLMAEDSWPVTSRAMQRTPGWHDAIDRALSAAPEPSPELCEKVAALMASALAQHLAGRPRQPE